MSRKYKIFDSSKPYFITLTVNSWVDVFTRKEYVDTILTNIAYCQKNKGLIVYAWCIMPSHLHLIVSSEKEEIQSIIRDFKSFTSKQFKVQVKEHPQESRKEWMYNLFISNDYKNGIKKSWQFWQPHFHPIELEGHEWIQQKLDYIHENPVKAGFVYEPEHWVFSSARDYAGLNGLLDVVLID